MNWRLIFSGTQSPLWTISVIVAVLLATGLFLTLRRYEARLVSPGIGRTLLTLRVLVLLVLLLTLLQPVLTKSWDEDQRHRLVIGFDVSESMDTADRHAAPAEMLRWAQALGMLGNDSTDELIEDWIAAYDAGQEPNWGGSNEGIHAARQHHIEGVFSELSGMSRTEFVQRLLTTKPNNLLEELRKNSDTDVQVFGTRHRSITQQELQSLLTSDRAEVLPGGTDAVGMLGSCIGEEEGKQIQGIVLFSDGRQTVSVDAAAEASRLGSLGIPVYCVPIGSVLSPRDLSIASVQVPQSVFVDDHVQIQTVLSSSGFTGDNLTVYLRREGEVIDEQSVTVASDSFELEFEIPAGEPGNHEYSISTDVQPGELREDNNEREFTVSVVDNEARVLLVEGDARWEFRYLKSALDRDKRVELSTVLFRQPYLQLLNRTFLDSDLPETAQFKEQLANTDLLVVGDVDAAWLPNDFWPTVEAAVADDSLTLLILPGRRHMPHGHDSPALEKLLPVVDTRPRLAERFQPSIVDAPQSVFRLRPTPAATDLTLFDISGPDDEQQNTTLAALPGHPWAYTGTAKPVASVWADVALDGTKLDGDAFAAVVHQYYGFGQVVWFGVDSTWRWRRRAGDRWHHRFWGQLVRWAARNKSAAGNDQVRMTLSDVIIDETEGVDVSVRWNPNLAGQLEGANVEVLVEPVEQPDSDVADPSQSRTLQLQALPNAPERFTGRLSGLQSGDYTVRLQVQDGRLNLETPIESELIVQKQRSTELANVSCNRDFLQQIATVSGGQMMEPWQLSELPSLISPDIQSRNVIQEKTLWDHWTLLVLFFVLLTAEWVIRKMNGLP